MVLIRRGDKYGIWSTQIPESELVEGALISYSIQYSFDGHVNSVSYRDIPVVAPGK
jgi:hypothetical protein